MPIEWKNRFALRTQRMGRSIIREMLKLSTQPGMISLAGGLPAPELFPIERIQQATSTVLTEKGRIALQYGETEGYYPLRQFICEQMSRYGIKTQPSNVVITHGSQQALDLIGKVLIDAGDKILVEEPSYLGALQAWIAYQAEFVAIPMDSEGIQPDLIKSTLQSKPKFMYILPNFQNPSGITLSLPRRNELIKISNEYGIPIIEDDPYGALRFEGLHIKPLVVLDAEYQQKQYRDESIIDNGTVIYLGTFSKTLAPGLRLGWIVAPNEILGQLVVAKQGVDLHTTMFTQVLAYEIVKDGFLDEHIPAIRQYYSERRDIMLASLQQYFPEGCSWTHPQGGLFLWTRVLDWMDTAELLAEAVKYKVVYVPGIAFYTDPTHGKNTMRLNFSNMQPDQIVEGIKRLGDMLKSVVRMRKGQPVR